MRFDGERLVLAGQLKRRPRISEQAFGAFVVVDGVAQAACLLGNRLRACGVVPKARFGYLRVERHQLRRLVVDVQEAVRIDDARGNLFDISDFFIHSFVMVSAKRPASAPGRLVASILRAPGRQTRASSREARLAPKGDQPRAAAMASSTSARRREDRASFSPWSAPPHRGLSARRTAR